MNRMAIYNLLDSMDRMTPTRGDESLPSSRLTGKSSADRQFVAQVVVTVLVWSAVAVLLGYLLAVAP